MREQVSPQGAYRSTEPERLKARLLVGEVLSADEGARPSASGGEREIEISGSVSIGRAVDNSICIESVNVSRYHAAIDLQEDGFYLSDLGSRNGTTLNGSPVQNARKLQDGDRISIGGDCSIDFYELESSPRAAKQAAEEEEDDEAAGAAVSSSTPAVAAPRRAASSQPSRALLIGGLLGGAAIVVLATLFLTGAFSSGEKTEVAQIVSPQAGTTLRGPEVVRVEVKDKKKVDRVIYQIDGVEVGSAAYYPYDISLNPAELSAKVPNLYKGNHILTVTVEDKDGNRTVQPDTILLSFESNDAGNSAEVSKNTAPVDGESASRPVANPTTSAGDISSLARNLSAQISQKSGYVFDVEFVNQINLRIGDYRVNVIDDARRYRREISNAFSNKGLPLSLGFVMAMAQSKFKEQPRVLGASNAELGFWRVPRALAVEQGYLNANESAVDEKRAAEIAASYLKALLDTFDRNDFMYAIACYGQPLSQAAGVRAKLEEIDPKATARRDFWSMVRAGVVSREAADKVARFFAAGIVGENPQAFGLTVEPLSSLY